MNDQLRLPMNPLPHCAGEPVAEVAADAEQQLELRLQYRDAAEDWLVTTRRLARYPQPNGRRAPGPSRSCS